MIDKVFTPEERDKVIRLMVSERKTIAQIAKVVGLSRARVDQIITRLDLIRAQPLKYKVVCLNCGKQFEVRPSEFKSGKRYFHSQECWKEFTKKQKALYAPIKKEKLRLAARKQYRKDPKKAYEITKRWSDKNPEKVRAYGRKRHLKYRDEENAKKKLYYQKNREKILARVRARRQMKKHDTKRPWRSKIK